MSKNSEMFRFTQLRPVNGIDYYKVQSKHFPLYDEDEPTSLLKKIEQEGLPQGLKHALAHIESAGFKKKLATFQGQTASKNTENISTYTLVSVLQKIINHTHDYPLIAGKHDDLGVLQYSRGMLSKYGLDRSKIKESIASIRIDTISDDLYSLLLLSSYHTEYRRYLDTLYRFKFLVNTYTLERIFNIFSPKDTSLEDEDYSILKRFLGGRILLPHSVRTNKKPLPKLDKSPDDDSSETQNTPETSKEAVKGISLSVIHQSIHMQKPTKIVKKKRKAIKKLKIKPSKISVRKEAKK